MPVIGMDRTSIVAVAGRRKRESISRIVRENESIQRAVGAGVAEVIALNRIRRDGMGGRSVVPPEDRVSRRNRHIEGLEEIIPRDHIDDGGTGHRRQYRHGETGDEYPPNARQTPPTLTIHAVSPWHTRANDRRGGLLNT